MNEKLLLVLKAIVMTAVITTLIVIFNRWFIDEQIETSIFIAATSMIFFGCSGITLGIQDMMACKRISTEAITNIKMGIMYLMVIEPVIILEYRENSQIFQRILIVAVCIGFMLIFYELRQESKKRQK